MTPWKNGWKIKKRKHAIKSSFLCLCYILRAIRTGRCRERRNADHTFIQIYFRMHHFVVKLKKIASGGNGAKSCGRSCVLGTSLTSSGPLSVRLHRYSPRGRQCSRICILRFFQISKNVTFYVFLRWRQKVVRKSLVLNPWKWVHILCSVITVIQFPLPQCDPFWLGYEANIARRLMLVAYRYWLSVIVY